MIKTLGPASTPRPGAHIGLAEARLAHQLARPRRLAAIPEGATFTASRDWRRTRPPSVLLGSLDCHPGIHIDPTGVRDGTAIA